MKICISGVFLLLFHSVLGSGTINFSTALLPGDVRIYEADGVTGLSGNGPYLVDMVVDGSPFLIDLNTQLPLQPFRFFKTPMHAGLFSGTPVLVDGVQAGYENHASVTVRAWDSSTGATYDTSTIRGAYTFTQTAFGSPPGLPPTIFPAMFTGFKGFSIKAVPEPTLSELGIISLAGFVATALFRHTQTKFKAAPEPQGGAE